MLTKHKPLFFLQDDINISYDVTFARMANECSALFEGAIQPPCKYSLQIFIFTILLQFNINNLAFLNRDRRGWRRMGCPCAFTWTVA